MSEAEECALGIDLPEQGWATWTAEAAEPQPRMPHPDWHHLCLPGKPTLPLALRGKTGVDVLHSDADEFRSAAFLDPLTGLGNRRALDELRPCESSALIAMDLDHCKAVNDQFGHPAGDEVLKAVARVLRQCLPRKDAVMRLDGGTTRSAVPGRQHRATPLSRVKIPRRPRGAVTQGPATVADGHRLPGTQKRAAGPSPSHQDTISSLRPGPMSPCTRSSVPDGSSAATMLPLRQLGDRSEASQQR